MMRDAYGHELSGATAKAVEYYERGLRSLQTFTGDPVGAADAAIAEAPDFVMAYALKGWLYGLATEPDATRVAAGVWKAASALPMTARERGHIESLGVLVAGGWNEAGRKLAVVAKDNPRDALALQIGHQLDFFTGNAPMLRDRIASALPFWDETMPGYHAMQAALAFGLEETGDYAAAERAGRRAVELEPSDGWGQHAVAHVMEMQCRQRDGIDWMRATPQAWAADSLMKVHNWWHLALFYYDLGEHDEVFKLYDGPIDGGASNIALDMVDASALLWRMWLGGVGVGERWQAIADRWTPHAATSNYAFNDMHAMMAFAGAGRRHEAETLLAAQEEKARGQGENASFTRDIGLPATRGIIAFADGDYVTAARLLEPIRTIAHRFGGSHAQRDVIDLTLIEAAIRSGDGGLAKRLTHERMEHRPHSALSAVLSKRAGMVTA